jgi:two-component system osmolarity sensor histidine kinase EnvZ
MRYIRNLLPKSLFARFALIIAVPAILFQILIIYLFYQRHWSNVATQTSHLIVNNIVALVRILDSGDIKLADQVASTLNVAIIKPAEKYQDIQSNISGREFRILAQELKAKFIDVKIFQRQNSLDIFIRKFDTLLQFRISNKPLTNPTTIVFVVWILCLNLFVIVVSIIFSKNQIRSILDLAKAADQFGKGVKLKYDFKPSGAREIRLAGFAFIKMRERIEGQINKHTKMLAMISHDLKTPLTRLKLQLALLPGMEIKAMEDDINSMQQMIDSYLNFAKGELVEEKQRIDLVELLSQYCQNKHYPNLELAFFNSIKEARANINVKNFLRVLDNIFSNSAKYADKSQIHLSKNRYILVDIHDNGPGVSKQESKLLTQPFYRSDISRRLGKEGNVGLGLTIAQEIIKDHFGELKVSRSKILGGLLVRIALPLQ